MSAPKKPKKKLRRAAPLESPAVPPPAAERKPPVAEAPPAAAAPPSPAPAAPNPTAAYGPGPASGIHDRRGRPNQRVLTFVVVGASCAVVMLVVVAVIAVAAATSTTSRQTASDADAGPRRRATAMSTGSLPTGGTTARLRLCLSTTMARRSTMAPPRTQAPPTRRPPRTRLPRSTRPSTTPRSASGFAAPAQPAKRIRGISRHALAVCAVPDAGRGAPVGSIHGGRRRVA